MNLRQLLIAVTGLGFVAAAPATVSAQALAGQYTIGAEGDYVSLATAVEALKNNGVSASVTFQLAPGLYDEMITITAIEGASKQNTITFAGTEGSPEDVVVTSTTRNGNNTGQFNPFYNTSAVITLNGADFITFKDLTVQLTSTAAPYDAFLIYGGATDITISGCSLFSTNLASRYGIVSVLSNASTPNDNLVLENSSFTGFNKALYARRDNKVSANVFSKNWRIENCTFTGANVTTQNIEAQFLADFSFCNNNFINDGIGGLYALSLTNISGEYSICGNKVDFRGTGKPSDQYGTYGARFVSVSSTFAPTGIIANNVVDIYNAGKGETSFIELSSSHNGKLLVANNTARIAYTNLTNDNIDKCGFITALNGTYGQIEVVNNLFVKTARGRMVRTMAPASGSVAFANNVFPEGEFAVVGLAANGLVEDAETLFARSNFSNENSVVASVDVTDELKPVDFADVAGKGKHLDKVTTDIDGAVRPEVPSIGAFEAPAQQALPLNGTYTIGDDGCDYATFTAAVEALKELGVDGPVTFNVASGTYCEQITIPAIEGVSEINTITFAGTEGAPEEVELTYDVWDGYTQYNTYYEMMTGTVNLDGADYITFRDITLSAMENGPLNVIILRNGAENFTLDGAVVTAPFTVKSYNGKDTCLLNSIQTNALNNGVKLLNTTFNGGNTQVAMHNGPNTDITHDFVVRGCTFTGNSTKSIDIAYTENIAIVNNFFESGRPYYDAWGYEFYNYEAVVAYRVGGNIEISANRCNADIKARKTTDSSRAVFLDIVIFGSDSETLIANNVALLSNQGWQDTVFARLGSIEGNAMILHNTVVVNNPNLNWDSTWSRSCALWFNESIAGKVLIANNSFQNIGKGYIYYGYDKCTGGNVVFANNHYNDVATFASPDSNLDKAISLDSWRAESGETGTVTASVDMDASLRPEPDALRILFAKGQSFAQVPYDHEGAVRPEIPTIGAFEAPGQVGVENIDATATGITVDGRSFTAVGLDGARVDIFDLSGKTVQSFVVDGQFYTRQLGIAPGVYVIRAAQASLKFAVTK